MSAVERKRESLCLVVNPQAGSGRAGRRLDDLARLAAEVFPDVEIRRTEGPGHATVLAREAAARGVDLVAAVGGDGTCNEVVNGLLDPPCEGGRTPIFTVIPYGTGSDLIRTLGIPRDTATALRLARDGETRAVDVGLARTRGPGGATLIRHFVNESSFGLSGDVVSRVNRSQKRFGGRVSFLGATLSSLVSSRSGDVCITWEDDGGTGSWEQPFLATFVANGQYCGGGMWVGRGGSMTDGLLDVTIVPFLSLPAAIPNLPRLYNGTAERVRGARRIAVRRIEARNADPSAPEVPVEMDGEEAGSLPLAIEVRPGALRVRASWPPTAVSAA
jgi:diacylglycerol kinase (ATP)